MKKLLIYFKDNFYSEPYLMRSINVTADFIGIGKKGQINKEEFKRLATDLEPNHYSIEVV